MKNKCSACNYHFSFIKAFFASRSFPAICTQCSVKNFRSHTVSYYFLVAIFSIGFLLILLVAMTKGFSFAKYIGISYVGVFLVIYLIETAFLDLKEYSNDIEKKTLAQGKKNAVIGLVLLITGVLSYIFLK